MGRRSRSGRGCGVSAVGVKQAPLTKTGRLVKNEAAFYGCSNPLRGAGKWCWSPHDNVALWKWFPPVAELLTGKSEICTARLRHSRQGTKSLLAHYVRSERPFPVGAAGLFIEGFVAGGASFSCSRLVGANVVRGA